MKPPSLTALVAMHRQTGDPFFSPAEMRERGDTFDNFTLRPAKEIPTATGPAQAYELTRRKPTPSGNAGSVWFTTGPSPRIIQPLI